MMIRKNRRREGGTQGNQIEREIEVKSKEDEERETRKGTSHADCFCFFQGTFVKAKGTVAGGDPGYLETAKMTSEAGLCLALESEKLPRRGTLISSERFTENKKKKRERKTKKNYLSLSLSLSLSLALSFSFSLPLSRSLFLSVYFL
jgi:hypothetical protein